MTETMDLSELSERELRENYTFDDLFKINKDLQRKLENAKNENKYREKRIAELSAENEQLHSRFIETEARKGLEIAQEAFELNRIRIDGSNDLIDRNTKLNATIDVLLERLK